MNTLMNPWTLLDELFDNRTFHKIRARAAGLFPPVNVYLDDGAVIVDLELPGKTAKDVDLTLEPQAAIISAKPTEGEAPAWSRRIELPFRVDTAKANAKFTDGILRVELPKSEEAGVRKIAIA